MARIGKDRSAAIERRMQCQAELDEINLTVRNLLDNITAANRGFADVRLSELSSEKDGLVAELAQVDRQTISDAQVQRDVADEHRFLNDLPALLVSEDHVARQGAVRRCVDGIRIAGDGRTAALSIHQSMPAWSSTDGPRGTPRAPTMLLAMTATR